MNRSVEGAASWNDVVYNGIVIILDIRMWKELTIPKWTIGN